ncbi:Serine/threonine protein phosphatase [Planococcus halocryophilus Or1]|uniref:Serine/threonine protein phosphatase n=1 Tax=Planococcus halocryophilus TaxID=1215089 RepID=A0A1C7DV16_9BACL|nr:metallophosphoesterase family protein [Planococcus halocryophilus]ANU15247.1 serine/threonine protein phosphatase [Planococcus halocryophilus]EMF47592.1 Serine/threonine protein phosphatase [Planococcus halocryophilus Or1]
MKRLLAISDIHGELELFNELLEKVEYDAAVDQLILLGDYVDRGPNSKRVLDRVMELKKQGAIVLRGNHDQMMLEAADGEPGAKENWVRNGGLATLQSYGSSIQNTTLPVSEVFREHVEFIQEMDHYYETDDYIFVHAGVQPGVPPQETDPYLLIWIRQEFHAGYSGNKTVIFGHTPTFVLRGTKNYDVYFGNNQIIGIDGGAVYGGQLNCLELPSRKVYSVRKS